MIGCSRSDRAQSLPMIRGLLWVLGGILLGGIVHLATVLLLPSTATRDAYDRLLAIAPVNSIAQLPAPTPEKAVLPFMDPAFFADVCRYDLSNGPLKLTTPVSQAYTSVSFYTRYGVAYYAINDRAAGRRGIELDADHGEDQHNCGFADVDTGSDALNAPILRKLDQCSHAPLPAHQSRRMPNF